MRIRSPSQLDRDAIAALIAAGPFRPAEVSCALELLDAAVARSDTYEALIAERDDAPPALVGYVCFGPVPMTAATWDVYWIVVASEAQGQGVGRALLAHTEDHLRTRGGRIVRIETSSLEGQGGAVRFYERAGYQRAGLIEGFYRSGDDLITLVKQLAP